jgi:hypothetical protein
LRGRYRGLYTDAKRRGSSPSEASTAAAAGAAAAESAQQQTRSSQPLFAAGTPADVSISPAAAAAGTGDSRPTGSSWGLTAALAEAAAAAAARSAERAKVSRCMEDTLAAQQAAGSALQGVQQQIAAAAEVLGAGPGPQSDETVAGGATQVI